MATVQDRVDELSQIVKQQMDNAIAEAVNRAGGWRNNNYRM
jgi:hypothetical protein